MFARQNGAFGTCFQLGFIPRSMESSANLSAGAGYTTTDGGMFRRARNSVSSFETSMFGSSHRVQIKEDSSSDEDSDYEPSSYSYFGNSAHRKQQQRKQPSNHFRKMRKDSIDFELFELSDKVSGVIHDFKLYNECDLPFLDPRN
jgi:hypothetical protein